MFAQYGFAAFISWNLMIFTVMIPFIFPRMARAIGSKLVQKDNEEKKRRRDELIRWMHPWIILGWFLGMMYSMYSFCPWIKTF
jgi:hypothetical protein